MDLPVDLPSVLDVLRDEGAIFALVFGSHAEGRATPESDVDLAVMGQGGLDMWRLRGLLPDRIDLVDLARAPEVLVGRIALQGLVVLDTEPSRRIRWQAQTRKRHLDESFRRKRFRRDFVKSHG